MHNDIKILCAKGQWREAIDFVSRIEPGPERKKTKSLVFLGNTLLQTPIDGKEREVLLVKVIEALLRLGDIESPQVFLLALNRKILCAKFASVIERTIRLRQEDMVMSGP